MEPTDELVNGLYWEQVRRARLMSDTDKLLAGPRLFERSCRIMCDGIRDEFPQATPAEVLRLLRERLALARRLESTT
ncbi:MAG: hypothetical protein K8T91_16970 [Planctomycetes bacterium]|nr:hypothetical protein [Planctomycetota bacterium]